MADTDTDDTSTADRLRTRATFRARDVRARLARAARLPGSAGEPRLVRQPVFILSSIRSGSTLLRVVLNSHSRICAPHELHMQTVKVALNANSEAAMTALGMSSRDLENLLWDRMLHLELTRSGKAIVVDKTPSNTFAWQRIQRAWPSARFIFLHRHPVRILESMVAAWPSVAMERHYAQLNRYSDALAVAREHLPGHVVRYEQLTTDPAGVARGLCDWLGVRFEPAMLDYVAHDHGAFASRLGDWHDTIKSGVIRPAAPDPAPEEIPAELVRSCTLLGY